MNPCAVCGHMIPPRPYQAKTARTCSPVCAKTLAAREQPATEPERPGYRSGYWRRRLELEAAERESPSPPTEKPS